MHLHYKVRLSMLGLLEKKPLTDHNFAFAGDVPLRTGHDGPNSSFVAGLLKTSLPTQPMQSRFSPFTVRLCLLVISKR